MKNLNEIRIVCIGDRGLLRDITIEKLDEYRIKVSLILESKYVDCLRWFDTMFRLEDSENDGRYAFVVLTTHNTDHINHYLDYPSIGDVRYYDDREGSLHTFILEDWNAPEYEITPSIQFKPYPTNAKE